MSLDQSSSASPDQAPNGVDVSRVEPWLLDAIPSLRPPLGYQAIEGGLSNLTFIGHDSTGTRFVLRRPPLGATLESAHDMGREYLILSALAESAVPVPATMAFCDSPEVNGAPFYVMEFLDGAVLREPADVVADFDEHLRRPLADSLIDTLAAIHTTDPDVVGLGDLGPRKDYLGRQLRRWKRQYEEVQAREIPAIEEVHRRLEAAKPPQQRDVIVHGDYRIDNVIFGPDATVIGVLDWELCTLGDPLADLGGLLVQWVEPGEDGSHMLDRTPTQLPGFPSREEIVGRYAAATGFDLSNVDYYVAFAYWRLACIGEGVYVRHRDGAMGDDRDPEMVARLGSQVIDLAERALARIG